MEIAHLSLRYLEVLVWPAIVLTAMLLFRNELRSLAASIQRLRLPGGTELDWKQSVQEAEEAADQVEALPKAKRSLDSAVDFKSFSQRIVEHDLLSSPSDYDFDYYTKIAESDPNLALAGLRMELERMLQNMAMIVGAKFDARRTSPGRFSGRLKAQGIIGEEEYRLLRSVINVANAALHGRDVSLDVARRTIRSAEAFVDTYIPFMTGAMDRIDVGIDNEVS